LLRGMAIFPPGRPGQHVIADQQRMRRGATQHRLLHDHAVGAHANRAAVGGQHGAVQHATARAHPDIAAEHRGLRDVGRRIH
jgi:hypothetical protein